MSKVLRKAFREVKEGNDIVNRVRHIGNKFLNAVENSAQEAVYFVLINTSHPDQRTFLLKDIETLRDLPDNSPDIEPDSMIKRYQRHPKQLENVF